MNWYYEGACKRYFLAIVLAFGAVKLFGHVDLIDTGMVYENMKTALEQQEREDQIREEQAMRDRQYQAMLEEERYYWMMSDKYEKGKKD